MKITETTLPILRAFRTKTLMGVVSNMVLGGRARAAMFNDAIRNRLGVDEKTVNDVSQVLLEDEHIVLADNFHKLMLGQEKMYIADSFLKAFDKYCADLNAKLAGPDSERYKKLHQDNLNAALSGKWSKILFDGEITSYVVVDNGTITLMQVDRVQTTAMQEYLQLSTFVTALSDGITLKTTPVVVIKMDASNISNTPDANYLTDLLTYMTYLVFFIRYADVETKIVNKKTTEKVNNNKIVNKSDYNVTMVDCTWFTEIIRTEGFKVRGHFKSQRYGPGLNSIKIIYIADYEKEGYHRAPKIINQ